MSTVPRRSRSAKPPTLPASPPLRDLAAGALLAEPEPCTTAALIGRMVALAGRWRGAVHAKGADLDTTGALFAVACVLAAIEIMITRWGTREATRLAAYGRALHTDATIGRMAEQSALTPYTPPAEDAPLFAALRSLCDDCWRTVSDASVPETKDVSWACACALRGLVTMLDRWGSPVAGSYRNLALDMAGPSLRATLASAPPTPSALLAIIDDQIHDIIAAGLDATAPPAERDLGRRAARRIIMDAERAIGEVRACVRAMAGAP